MARGSVCFSDPPRPSALDSTGTANVSQMCQEMSRVLRREQWAGALVCAAVVFTRPPLSPCQRVATS